jgi:hypothetical protein
MGYIEKYHPSIVLQAMLIQDAVAAQCSLRVFECMADLILSSDDVIPSETSLQAMQVYSMHRTLTVGTPERGDASPRDNKEPRLPLDQSCHSNFTFSKSRYNRRLNATTDADVKE